MTDEANLPVDPRDLTAEERANLKIEFAPGCFDDFQGSQEELDDLIKTIQEMVTSGSIFDEAKALDMDELIEEDPEFAQFLMERLAGHDIAKDRKRNLN